MYASRLKKFDFWIDHRWNRHSLMDGLKVISGRDIIPQNGHNGSPVVDHREEIIFKWWLNWLLLFTKSGSESQILREPEHRRAEQHWKLASPLFSQHWKSHYGFIFAALKNGISMAKKGKNGSKFLARCNFLWLGHPLSGAIKTLGSAFAIAWILGRVTSTF